MSHPNMPLVNSQGGEGCPIQGNIEPNNNSPISPGATSQHSTEEPRLGLTPTCELPSSPYGAFDIERHNGGVPSLAKPQGSSLLGTPPKVGNRFSPGSIRVLRDWFVRHEHHPYPSTEDVEMLQHQTGLTKQQVTTWLANYRRRSKLQTTRPASPHVRSWDGPSIVGPGPTEVPRRRATPAPVEQMNPLQRWENSPPEHEAALVSDISRAVAASVSPPSEPGTRPRTSGRSSRNASSAGSVDTSRSSIGSGSRSSVYSHLSRASSDSLKRSANRKRRRAINKRQENNGRRSIFQAYNTYQCTFCTETFKTKYDWQRHEKSFHLSLEEWTCSPEGSTEVHPQMGSLCVYCGSANPDQDHLNSHNHAACLERPFAERTFYRKDHLHQHLKLVHGTEYMRWPMENWQITKEVRSRCGFCDLQLDSWASRADHLAGHFKSGSTMANWKGDWGFEPSVIEMLDNAMPPYLIHYEQNSPLPFSAIQGPADTPSSAYELIKLELEYYMRNYYDSHGEEPCDKKLQYEACSIIFGAEVISQHPASSTPSWLRDVALDNHEVTKQARIRPMKQVAKSRMSQLKIIGKGNIFEKCELEIQLCRYISMHVALGLSLSDYDLQQEACNTVSRVESLSPNPSARFVEFITRIIWDSTNWLKPLRRRGREISHGMTSNSLQTLGSGEIEPFLAANLGDPQQFQLDPSQQDVVIPSLVGTEHFAHARLDSGRAWTTPNSNTRQPQLPTFAAYRTSMSHNPFLPGNNTSSPSGTHTAGFLPPASDHTTISVSAHGFPTSHSTFESGYSSGRGSIVTPVAPHFLNDSNSYRRLARELSRFVTSCTSLKNPNSHIPTDDELRYQARWILYDDDDPWNQTPADNEEWLGEFKRDVGLTLSDSDHAHHSDLFGPRT